MVMMPMMMVVVMMTVAVVYTMVFGIVFDTCALHMVVVADLRRAVIVFVTDDLFTVFTQLAVHITRAVQSLFHTRNKRIDNFGVIIQISGFQNFNIRVRKLRFIRPIVDAGDQNAGEQEVREHNDPFETHLRDARQSLIHERIRNA